MQVYSYDVPHLLYRVYSCKLSHQIDDYNVYCSYEYRIQSTEYPVQSAECSSWLYEIVEINLSYYLPDTRYIYSLDYDVPVCVQVFGSGCAAFDSPCR